MRGFAFASVALAVATLGSACVRPAIETDRYLCASDKDCLWGWTCRPGKNSVKTCQVGAGNEPDLVGRTELDRGTFREQTVLHIDRDRSTPPPTFCPAPADGSISVCLQGRVVEGLAFLTFAGSLAVKSGDLSLKVYDLSAPTSPVANTLVDQNGNFVVENVPPPGPLGAYLIEVDDGAKDQFARTGTTVTVSSSARKVEGLLIPILERTVFTGLDLATKGTLLVQFRRLKGSGVPHVTPTKSGAPPPWAGIDVHYFTDNLSSPPYWLDGAVETTTSGLVALQAAPVAVYGGVGTGCTAAGGPGFSLPGVINLLFLQVEGC